MFNISDKSSSIDFILTSEWDMVGRVIDASRAFLLRHNITRTDHLQTCMQELLDNALRHGNKNKREKLIYCSIEVLSDRNQLKFIVEDQGAGYDHETMTERTFSKKNGCNQVKDCSMQCIINEAGNRTTVFIDITPPTSFNVTTDDGYTTITPSGNLVAPVCNELKEVLRNVIHTHPQKLRFDLRNVSHIDSVALSALIVFARQDAENAAIQILEITKSKQELYNLFILTGLTEMYRVF